MLRRCQSDQNDRVTLNPRSMPCTNSPPDSADADPRRRTEGFDGLTEGLGNRAALDTVHATLLSWDKTSRRETNRRKPSGRGHLPATCPAPGGNCTTFIRHHDEGRS